MKKSSYNENFKSFWLKLSGKFAIEIRECILILNSAYSEMFPSNFSTEIGGNEKIAEGSGGTKVAFILSWALKWQTWVEKSAFWKK